MSMFLRWVLVVGGFAFSAELLASNDLTLVRSSVGLVGRPVQLTGKLDSNHNGRGELLIATATSVVIVEEDTSLRGYREIVRSGASGLSFFENALLVDIPGAEPALLLQWMDGLQLRDAATLGIKKTIVGSFRKPAFGDVDGDGVPEILLLRDGAIRLLDPTTLEERGSVPLYPPGEIVVADIVGDERAEIVTGGGYAYSVTRNGDAWTATEVWDAGLSELWRLHVVDYEGRSAIVLHDGFGYSAQLATFWPSPSIRWLVPPYGSSFSVVFADANSDGRVDIITAGAHELRALDMTSGSTLWERDTIYQAPSLGRVNMPIATDLDDDGTPELVWADASSNAGIVAVSIPPTGAPRWRTDSRQSEMVDWTVLRRTGGQASFAYLTRATQELPGLGSIGFLDGSTFADQGGSAFAWLPGYNGFSGPTARQNAISSAPVAGPMGAVVVAGAEYSIGAGYPIARWLWTFDGNGALLSSQALVSSTDPQRIATAQVLDRPERQLVVAGWIPASESFPSTQSVRVEIVDYADGSVLWQSEPLPTYNGAPVAKLEVADLDADGQLEIVVAYGTNVAIFKPSTGSAVVVEHDASQFALLELGAGENAMLATLDRTDVMSTDVIFYEGLSGAPKKKYVLPESVSSIALLRQAPENAPMFVTGTYGQLVVRRYADGEIVTSLPSVFPGASLSAMDIDGDGRAEIIGVDQGFGIWRFDQYMFRDGFDGTSPGAASASDQ